MGLSHLLFVCLFCQLPATSGNWAVLECEAFTLNSYTIIPRKEMFTCVNCTLNSGLMGAGCCCHLFTF